MIAAGGGHRHPQSSSFDDPLTQTANHTHTLKNFSLKLLTPVMVVCVCHSCSKTLMWARGRIIEKSSPSPPSFHIIHMHSRAMRRVVRIRITLRRRRGAHAILPCDNDLHLPIAAPTASQLRIAIENPLPALRALSSASRAHAPTLTLNIRIVGQFT
jgi:hypothetical protein